MNPSLETMSREELRRLAKNRGLNVSAKSRKADLVAALSKVADLDTPSDGVRAARHLSDPAIVATAAPDLRSDDAAVPASHDIPWGYGETLVVALARDPQWLYVYWEVTDEAMAAARDKLGPSGNTAFFALRVYDTTYRLFDGTNANSYFDVAVDRVLRSYFLKVDRPRTVFHVEMGMKSQDGQFVAMARSGAAEMPADSVSADGRVEWMTVTPAPRPSQLPVYLHRHTPRSYPASSPGSYGGPFDAGTSFHMSSRTQPEAGAHGGTVWWQGEGARTFQFLFGGETQRSDWFEQVVGGRFVRWVSWQGTRQQFSWHTGPIRVPLQYIGPVEIWFEGQRHVIQSGAHGAERVEFGPWQVVINGIGAHGERRVLDTWLIHMSWGGYGVFERVQSPALYHRIFGAYGKRSIHAGASETLIREEVGASQELFAGASERLWLGGSEMLLGGASETLSLGASELWAQGASEVFALGASETMWGGASLFAGQGASERLQGGASEFLAGGASLFGGASALGGASRSALGGGSEQLYQGGSEAIVGMSSGANWHGFAVTPVATGPLAGRGAPVAVSHVADNRTTTSALAPTAVRVATPIAVPKLEPRSPTGGSAPATRATPAAPKSKRSGAALPTMAESVAASAAAVPSAPARKAAAKPRVSATTTKAAGAGKSTSKSTSKSPTVKAATTKASSARASTAQASTATKRAKTPSKPKSRLPRP